jgi:hypothetical protein
MSKNIQAYSKNSDREISIFLGDVPKCVDGCTGIEQTPWRATFFRDSVSLSEGLSFFKIL